ncbi:MAG: hypothetical protein ABJF10_04520 [Chthoniobacter sp.]|uniref:hypothetical protein n=1 Tax=Chthoniobacter sp. TaxID=2510640 RepID=UPI0032A6D735
MKTPRRLLPILLFTIAGFSSTSSLSIRADDAKADAGPPPTPEEIKAVGELSSHGVRAEQVANGVNWRYVNFRGADKPDAALYVRLKSVPSIVELSLAGMKFAPEDLANIASLKNLTTLNLSGSNVTDDGLKAVENLEKLSSLNLFSTGITDAGLSHLAHLKNLRRLYLADTKVTDAGVETLKKSLPEAKINRGAELIIPPVATPAPKPAEEKPAAPAPKPEEKKPEPPAPPKPPEAKPAPPAAKPEDKKPDPAK